MPRRSSNNNFDPKERALAVAETELFLPRRIGAVDLGRVRDVAALSC